jgi:hypothetical protein
MAKVEYVGVSRMPFGDHPVHLALDHRPSG